MNSYLSQDEIDRMQESSLSRDTPYLIQYVTQTQFSIARYYGGIKFNGSHFEYLPETDELIRSDVRMLVNKWRKPKRTKAKKQKELFQ